MDAPGNLSSFFKEFESITTLLQRFLPFSEDKLLGVLDENPSCENPDEEVFAGLPTLNNSKTMFTLLHQCVPPDASIEVFVKKSSQRVNRAVFNGLELVAVLASIYNLCPTERDVWLAIEQLAHASDRVLDETHAFLNRLFIDLTEVETEYYANKEEAKRLITEIQSQLIKNKGLLLAYDDLISRVRIPTPHAYLQCIVIETYRIYIEYHSDWYAIDSRLDLMLLRYTNFLEGKSWAAVYCRGFVHWLRLHARSISGTPSAIVNDNDSGGAMGPLFAAIYVRLHGRTLVRFMLSHCEQKSPKLDNANEKENQQPNSNQTSTSDSKSLLWTGHQVSESDLLNIWLGTRLLLHGSLQVAEFYTILGTVKEARVYQLELLRVAQRFHVPYLAQTAISLMAHTDLLAQRKWAFELRLSQINHILCSKTSLGDLLVGRPMKRTTKSGDQEASFLKTIQSPPHSGSVAEETEIDSSMAANPLINAAAGGLPVTEFFPTSPIKSVGLLSSSPGGFPSMSALCKAICPESVISPGVQTATLCSLRILYGCSWNWLIEVSQLVRKELIETNRYLPALVRPRGFLGSSAHNKQPEFHSVKGCSETSKRRPVNESEELDLSKAFDDHCNLTPPKTRSSSSAILMPSTKAGRAGRSRGELGFRTPAAKPLPLTEIEKNLDGGTGQPLVKAPDAPLRMADLARLEAASMNRTMCRSTTRERSAPAPAASSHVPATPLPTRSRRGNVKQSSEHDGEPRASSAHILQTSGTQFSLFDPVKSTGAFMFGPLADIKPVSRSLQVHYDFPENQADAPRLRLFKAPNPVKKSLKEVTKTTDPRLYQKSLGLKRLGDAGKAELACALREGDNDPFEDTETCPSIFTQPSRPMNLRMGERWVAAATRRRRLRTGDDGDIMNGDIFDNIEAVSAAEERETRLTEQLHSVYLALSGVPVPRLVRPVCQYLGLRWLGLHDERQAARYLAQSVGLAASTLYASILSTTYKSKTQHRLPTELLTLYSLSAPNDIQFPLTTNTSSTPQRPLLVVIQLSLIDEISELTCMKDANEPPRNLIPGALGARSRAHLVATRWVVYSATCGPCPSESHQTRVLHAFSKNGLQLVDSFHDIQTDSLDSMHESDRRRFWSKRFALDSKLNTLICQMRDDWFSADDISWLFAKEIDSINQLSVVLILDRRLVFLPWEWIIWGVDESTGADSREHHPTVCRSFSLPLVMSHLSTHVSDNSLTPMFDANSAFYVLNPESNLPHTEAQFCDFIRENFGTWRGVVGRMPSGKDVVEGFTQKDLFIYLGHGNGSRFLMNTFDEGLVAKAVALIIGCSSGRPRLDGRHEPYASVFNHLIAGCPTVVSLLWDVTDRDIDRFTENFLKRWLVDGQSNSARAALGGQIFSAVNACKLQSLVGKSVVVYGLPAAPISCEAPVLAKLS